MSNLDAGIPLDPPHESSGNDDATLASTVPYAGTLPHSAAIRTATAATADAAAAPGELLIRALPWTPRQRQVRIAIVMTVGALVIMGGAIALSAYLGRRWLLIGVATTPLFILSIVLFRFWRLRVRIRQAIDNHVNSEFGTLVDAIVSALDAPIQPRVFKKELPKLVQRGIVNQAVCITLPKDGIDVTPIEVTFEPREINEADATFQELETGVAAVQGDGVNNRPPESRSALRRNIRLRGGLIASFYIFYQLVMAGIDSYTRMQITPRMMIWSALLFFFLLVPRGGLYRKLTWLIAPRSVILRRRKAKDGRRVHVFDRHTSVLLTFPLNKLLWILCVTDGNESEVLPVTRAEMEMTLRAWLSPCEPPPIERLSDFE